MNKSLLEPVSSVKAVRAEIAITDMSVCEPGSAISAEGKRDCWNLYQYETEDGVTGRLLFAGEAEKLSELRLRLPVRGRYEIRIGVLADDGMGNWTAPCIKLKLGSDPCFSEITTKGKYFWPTVRDTWWREETLDHDELIISKAGNFKGGLAYVRLIPVEVPTDVPADSGDEPYLIVTNDSYSAYESVDELCEKIYPLRGTAVRKLMFGFANGDCCYYLDTKVGTRFRDLPMEGKSFPRALDRHFFKTISNLGSREDVLGQVCDFTHGLNIEFHASVRMEAFAMHPPMDCFTSKFFAENPQWRCVDFDGRPIARMSYAYPQVQQHMIDLFDEFLRYDIDGLNLVYIRGCPVMLYEDVLIEGFRQKTGKDARALAENDSDFSAYRADVLSGFMRRVREHMDERCRQLGRRRLQISVVCPANGDVNRQYGLDVQRWVSEGLVDFVCPDISLQNLEHDESPENIDMDHYTRMVRETPVGLLPRMPSYHELMSPAEYRKKFDEVFAEMRGRGVAGMMLWDGAHTFYRDPDVWERVIHFGKVYKQRLPRNIAFRELGGFVMDRFPAHMCF